MPGNRRPNRDRRPTKPRRPGARAGGPAAKDRIIVRQVPGQEAFELVYPRCVQQRTEDMEEVHAMLEAGEVDVAVDELRWLLEGCRALLEAHRLLGEAALTDNDVALARAHFGYGYELGMAAIPGGGLPGPLPYSLPANQPLFEAGKGLAWCLRQQGETDTAAQVVQRLVALDPSDPLNLKGLL